MPPAPPQGELRTTNESLRLLNDFGVRISRASSIDEMLPHVAEAILALLLADRATVGTLEGEDLVLRVVRGDARDVFVKRASPASNPIIERVIVRGEILLVNNLQDPDCTEPILQPLRHMGLHATVSVPLRAGDTIVGALGASRLQPLPFSEEDIALLELLGAHVASAIVRADAMCALERSREAAVAALSAKAQFLANISHEIRTPMNGVLGMTELALMEPTSATVREYLQTIKQSGSYLLRILNDLLDASRIESGQLELESVAFSPTEELGNVLSLFKPDAIRRGINLSLDVSADVPSTVLGDPLRVRQVISNLIGNALKFTVVGSVSVRAFTEAAGLVITVRDTGVGIAIEKQAVIFEPFVQADSSTTRRFGGSGLGLAIAQQLARRMGGDISVQSALGQGATFRFSFAAATVPKLMATATNPGVGALVLPPLRVLVAEDNAVNQRLAMLFLEKLGHSSRAVDDGAAALRALEAQSYDVVFMDVQMPVLDGMQATRLLRQREGQSRPTQVVALTANARSEDRQACIDAGMNDFLSKPFSLDDLQSVLARAWERLQALAPVTVV
ncbi:MAG: ATP-binding protein [Deltaproteobacteria bacterium]|nr:ATP-binding protein [Deltaproteobacteria bacterium]